MSKERKAIARTPEYFKAFDATLEYWTVNGSRGNAIVVPGPSNATTHTFYGVVCYGDDVKVKKFVIRRNPREIVP